MVGRPTLEPLKKGATPVVEFLRTEAGGATILLFATVTSLILANSGWGEGYEDFWHRELTLPPIGPSLTLDLRHWVNEFLMTLFFFVVGLEIKRELVVGELREPAKAALPVLAAAGGMVFPALVYLLIAGSSAPSGWAIPVATDIAFALGVLALFGSRLPTGLRTFLLTLAIADDIGAILIIALFYSEGLSAPWLGLAAVGVLAALLLRVAGAVSPWWYLLPASFVWLSVYESDIHATIAGVILALLVPTTARNGREVLAQLEHRLHPWSSFVVVPLFALANAGVSLQGDAVADALAGALFWGIAAGLVVGKTVGIFGVAVLAARTPVGRLPGGVGSLHLAGAAAVAGIGFTVSLFVADLAFSGDPAVLAQAKVAILAGSLTSAVLGSLLLLGAVRSSGGGDIMTDNQS